MAEDISKKYEELFRQQAAVNPVFTHAARQQMAEILEAAALGRANIEAELASGRAAAQKGGFIAEEWHAVSFNLDAILKEKKIRAVTDRYRIKWTELGKGPNDTPADIVVTEDGKIFLQVQVKYNKTPEDAVTGSNSFSQIKDGQPKYKDSDTFLGPSDHVDPKDGSVSIAEHAEASAQASASRGGKGAEVDRFQQISDKIKSKIECRGVSSERLTKKESTDMAEGNLEKLNNLEETYKTKSTIRQASRAAVGAAAMAAVVSGAVNTVRYVQMAREGKISAGDATLKVVAETTVAAVDSAVKAGSVAGAQSLLVRKGVEKAVAGAVAQQGIRSLARTNAVTVAVVCAVDAVKDLVALGMGKISKAQFYERQGVNILSTAAGVTGGTLGVMAANAVASGLGIAASTGGVALLPLIGGLAGGIIASMAMRSVIDNCIERPYRELMLNTALCQESAMELERISVQVFQSKVLFSCIMEEEYRFDKMFHASMARMDDNNQKLRNIINQI